MDRPPGRPRPLALAPRPRAGGGLRRAGAAPRSAPPRNRARNARQNAPAHPLPCPAGRHAVRHPGKTAGPPAADDDARCPAWPCHTPVATCWSCIRSTCAVNNPSPGPTLCAEAQGQKRKAASGASLILSIFAKHKWGGGPPQAGRRGSPIPPFPLPPPCAFAPRRPPPGKTSARLLPESNKSGTNRPHVPQHHLHPRRA